MLRFVDMDGGTRSPSHPESERTGLKVPHEVIR